MKMRAIASELASVFCNLFASNSSCSNGPGFSKFPCKNTLYCHFDLQNGKFSRLGVTYPLYPLKFRSWSKS